jgi:hypothetical protein
MALIVLLVLLVFSLIFTFIMLSSVIGFLMTRVPYVRTRTQDIKELIKKVPIETQDVFFELGSGDGKVSLLVEKVSGAKVKGFELTLWTHWLSKVKAKAIGSDAKFVLGNFFKQDFSEASVIYCYLFPGLMDPIGAKVMKECKPGTKIISRDFPIPYLPLEKSWESPTGHTIYFYKI